LSSKKKINLEIGKKYKDKQTITYGIPLIVATRSFNEQYAELNIDYFYYMIFKRTFLKAI
jgi:hypothetical protein